MGKRKSLLFIILLMAPLLFFFQNCGKVSFVGSNSDGSINTGNILKLNSFKVLDFLSVGSRTEIALIKSADTDEYIFDLSSGNASASNEVDSVVLGDIHNPIRADYRCRNQLILNNDQVLQLQTLLQMAEICVFTRDPAEPAFCQGNISTHVIDFDIESTRSHILLQDSCSQNTYNILCENSEINASLFSYVRDLIQLSGATPECVDTYSSALPTPIIK